MQRGCAIAAGVAVAFAGMLALPSGAAAGQPAPAAERVPVTDAMLRDPAPADWLMWRRTLEGGGYSPLDQITRENVGELRMVWSRALGAGSQEGTPIAYGGVLFMPNPSDVIQAISTTRSSGCSSTPPWRPT